MERPSEVQASVSQTACVHRRFLATDKLDTPEITDYFCQTQRGFIPAFTVATRNGIFDFTSALNDGHIVTALIARNAPVGEGKWRSRDNSTAAETGAHGITAHHYRTLQNRAGLWLLSSMAFAIPLSVLVRYALDSSRVDESATFVTIFFLFALPTAYGWLGYFRSRIEWDAAGITQCTAFGGRRHLPWGAITAYRRINPDADRNGPSIGFIKGTTTRLRYGFSISSLDDLQREIERRTKSVG